MRSASVVLDEFDIICTSISPDEADTPLRIHTDAVLSAPVTNETLQPIPGRDSQIIEILRCVDQLQLPHGRPLHSPLDAFEVLLMPGALGILVAERY